MSSRSTPFLVLLSLRSCSPLLPPTHSQPYKCATDDDCSLNGLCSPRHLHLPVRPSLDRPRLRHTGPRACQPQLRIQPQPPKEPAPGEASRWRDPASGGWVLFAAEITGGCGLDYWSPMSRVVRAVSGGGPAGPYVFDKEVVGTFAHNPTVVWSEADKLWLLYHIGCKFPQPTSCQYGGITCDDANNENGESSISLWSSSDLSNWQPHGRRARAQQEPHVGHGSQNTQTAGEAKQYRSSITIMHSFSLRVHFICRIETSGHNQPIPLPTLVTNQSHNRNPSRLSWLPIQLRCAQKC